jgi:predicted DNA-binding transcriptional regulator YafY
MAIIRIDRAPVRAIPKPRLDRSALARAWFTTSQAAAMLGVSERTLRRRIARGAWIQGVHYRWITRQSRRTLEVNVSRVIKLMEACGWG